MQNKGDMMKKLYFKVEFLSDIVLQATSNNEGKIENLDFIPGSNFLGMVAKNYNDFKNPFDIFHSKKVRFGDAMMIKDNKLTYKMPLSFFHKKLDSEIIFNHHLVENFSELGQLKQKREGYIVVDDEKIDEVNVEYKYSQKSAYNSKKRKSLDKNMYGYKAIKKGSVWQFCVTCNGIDDEEIKKIEKYLIGKQRLGKSKSAEYGLVEISKGEIIENIKTKQSENYCYLYCKSRLALFDENNNPTFDVKYIFGEDFKEFEKSIVYPKIQIKTSTFTPYNGVRKTKDYERVVINAGSVIVLNLENINQEKLHEIIEKGVGGYLNEGFGEIIINPSFLFQNEFKFQKSSKENERETKFESDKNVIQFLLNRKEKEKELSDILKEIDRVVEDKRNKEIMKNIKSSQWGKIRAILNSNDENYQNTILDYISNGVKKWETSQIEFLKSFLDTKSKKFMKMLVVSFQKVAKKGEK